MNRKTLSPKWLLYRWRYRHRWGGCCDSHWGHELYRLDGDPPGDYTCWMCGKKHLSDEGYSERLGVVEKLRKKGIL